MELSERQEQIIRMLEKEDSLNVDELAQQYGVTTQTIRRDLNVLCDCGLARRRYGGIQRSIQMQNQTYASRQILNRHAKACIAAMVARHIENGSSLAFSIGTTPEMVAGALLKHQDLRIITNNLNVAMLAAANPGFEITVTGGRMRNDDRDILGSGTERIFSSYKVDIGIFGVAGVDEDGTLLDFHEDEVTVRKIIQENCRFSYLVLDHSKFSRNAHVRGGSIGSVDKVFCDKFPPEKILAKLRSSKTEVVVCE